MTLPQRLSSDLQTALKAAKDAMGNAQAAAQASMIYWDRVITISQTITAGPNGKSLADEAKAAAADDQTAAEQAQDAANTAHT